MRFKIEQCDAFAFVGRARHVRQEWDGWLARRESTDYVPTLLKFGAVECASRGVRTRRASRCISNGARSSIVAGSAGHSLTSTGPAAHANVYARAGAIVAGARSGHTTRPSSAVEGVAEPQNTPCLRLEQTTRTPALPGARCPNAIAQPLCKLSAR